MPTASLSTGAVTNRRSADDDRLVTDSPRRIAPTALGTQRPLAREPSSAPVVLDCTPSSYFGLRPPSAKKRWARFA
jgi:hypothetical protein